MRRPIPKSDLSVSPHITLLIYLLIQDFEWKYIFIQLSIIITLLFTTKKHVSRLLLPTFIFGYLLSNHRFHDTILIILYVYKYQEHNIEIIYSTIVVLSMCKYFLLSIYHKNILFTIVQLLSIVSCISYHDMLKKIKLDPTFFSSHSMKSFRQISLLFEKEKKLLNKSEVCSILNLAWHICSACYLYSLYSEDAYKM